MWLKNCMGKPRRGIRGEAMTNTQVQFSNAQEGSEAFSEPTQLATVIRSMIREIKRLHEDNLQLHAAVKMYKEVVRLYSSRMG